MDWIDISIEEYKTLREESLISMQMQQAVLRYGLAIVGLLIVAAINAWDKVVLSATVLLVFCLLFVTSFL